MPEQVTNTTNQEPVVNPETPAPTQSRWKSKVVWATLIATLLTLFGNLGLYEAIGITQAPLQALADAVLALLTAYGVLNNPTDPNNF